MTKTFEHFLRSLSDEDLSLFARDRRAVEPPYWKVMRLALRIEAARRGLRLHDGADETPAVTTEPEPRTGTI